jgi:hypothetical protein
MPKIVVCEKAEDIRNVDADTIIIISRVNLVSLFSEAKTERLKDILDAIKKEAPKDPIIHWFDIPKNDIENHQITKGLRAINEKIKVFNERIIAVDLLETFLKAGVIPVLII